MSQTGPYLTIAAICERVLRETDGVNSLIRIFDRWNVQAQFARMPPTPIQLTFAVSLKAGGYKGNVQVEIRPVSPSGKPLETFKLPAGVFNGTPEDEGGNYILNLLFTAEEEGTYWFEVLFNGNALTKVPLTVTYSTAGASSTQAPRSQ